ncbi:MAG: UDP-3-O-(3-hydroxymyristoyl)glucosamine N-acyltransferase [Flavobacteriales bacterium]|nr:UDP-3-O-(3-hydroxymyristoyl)glucosamine N-acyltransferase [Flavobacteriales bacterium]
MKFDKRYKLDEFAKELGLSFKGNANAEISGINEIHRVEEGDIVFVDHPKYYQKALNSAATVVLINKDDVEIPEGKGIIIHDDPFSLFNKILRSHSPVEFPSTSKTAADFPNCQIHPTAFIDKWVEIGEGSKIYPGVHILGKVKIGKNVIIQSGTVIGSDGFYYKKREKTFDRLGSEGSVEIEDGAEIGANCTIDRGVTAVTKIGRNTVLDNMVQVGHDTVIGAQCLIAAQCGIAGCTTLEDKVTLWGQVGVSSGLTIGEGAVVHATSGVDKNLEPGKVYFGAPARESREKLKEMATLRSLPQVLEKLKNNGK